MKREWWKRIDMEQKDMMPYFIVMVMVTVLAVAVSLWLAFDRKGESETAKESNPVQSLLQDTKANGVQVDVKGDTQAVDIVQKVAQHVYLPSGQVVVKQIVDVNDLKRRDPIFFQNAQPNDYLLFYSDRVILYNPTVDRVIEVVRVPTAVPASP